MLPDLFRNLSDEAWLAVLKDSTERRRVLGHDFPSYPSPAFQENFVGSSYNHALDEAYQFYQLVKGYAKALARPLNRDTGFLDFGCGWGRYMRMFWRDLSEGKMHGCDVNSRLMFMNQWSGLPGTYSGIENGKPLPYPDKSFDTIIAYSVFTHLPEAVADHWLAELDRVARPGCVVVLTFWSARFLEYIATEGPKGTSPWLSMLWGHEKRFPEMREAIKRGELAYMPNGGFELSTDQYGDTIISENYVRKKWGKRFAVREIIDDGSRFVQAIAIMQKR